MKDIKEKQERQITQNCTLLEKNADRERERNKEREQERAESEKLKQEIKQNAAAMLEKMEKMREEAESEKEEMASAHSAQIKTFWLEREKEREDRGRAAEAELESLRKLGALELEEREKAAAAMIEQLKQVHAREQQERDAAAAAELDEARLGWEQEKKTLEEEVDKLRKAAERLQELIRVERLRDAEDIKGFAVRMGVFMEGDRILEDSMQQLSSMVEAVEMAMQLLHRQCMEKEEEEEATKRSLEVLEEKFANTVDLCGQQIEAISAARDKSIAEEREQARQSSMKREQELEAHLLAYQNGTLTVERLLVQLSTMADAADSAMRMRDCAHEAEKACLTQKLVERELLMGQMQEERRREINEVRALMTEEGVASQDYDRVVENTILRRRDLIRASRSHPASSVVTEISDS